MKRTIMLVTVALVMALMLVFAGPASAQGSDCGSLISSLAKTAEPNFGQQEKGEIQEVGGRAFGEAFSGFCSPA